MAKTLKAVGAAITANAAAVGSAASITTAEAQALGAFLSAAGLKPGLAIEILRLINNKELTEDR